MLESRFPSPVAHEPPWLTLQLRPLGAIVRIKVGRMILRGQTQSPEAPASLSAFLPAGGIQFYGVLSVLLTQFVRQARLLSLLNRMASTKDFLCFVPESDYMVLFHILIQSSQFIIFRCFKSVLSK